MQLRSENMEKTNAEIIKEFNNLEELTTWLIEKHEDNMKTIQWEFYGGRNYEKKRRGINKGTSYEI